MSVSFSVTFNRLQKLATPVDNLTTGFGFEASAAAAAAVPGTIGRHQWPFTRSLVMVALCNRADHYIFAL